MGKMRMKRKEEEEEEEVEEKRRKHTHRQCVVGSGGRQWALCILQLEFVSRAS